MIYGSEMRGGVHLCRMAQPETLAGMSMYVDGQMPFLCLVEGAIYIGYVQSTFSGNRRLTSDLCYPPSSMALNADLSINERGTHLNIILQ